MTDGRGRYHFIALPIVGEYSVKIELPGFGAEERSGLIFQANTKPVIDFTLKIAALSEETTHVGVTPILETRKSELSLTVDQKKIETMPLNGRNYLDLANFANGVHGAATRGDLSINGQLGRNIDYVVDGVSNKVIEWGDASKTGLSLDIVQEFQVITSQFSAEFGHALGGIVSAVTKSGTNELHGTGYVYDRPGALDAKNGLDRDADAVQPAAVRRRPLRPDRQEPHALHRQLRGHESGFGARGHLRRSSRVRSRPR